MSIAGLEYRHAFGLKTETTGNIAFVDEHTVMYPSGSNIILYNHESKSQRFIHLTEKSDSITSIALSLNKKWLAIAEQGKKPIIVFHEINTMRKRKTINFPEMEAKEIISMSFSSDSKFIVTQTAGPDWLMHFWSWEKSKILASIKTVNIVEKNLPIIAGAVKEQKDSLLGTTVCQCLMNPTDNTLMSVIGNGIFKIFRYAENALKLVASPKIEQRNILTHCWLPDERIGCGTEDGKLMIFEMSGELKFEITHTVDQTPSAINIMINSTKGILLGCHGGKVSLYDKEENATLLQQQQQAVINKDAYRKAREFCLPDEQQPIAKIAINPAEDYFVSATANAQIFYCSLSNTDVKGEESKMEVFSQPFHHGQVTGMDTCIRKPLVVTCSTDRSVRVWNYIENTSELVKYFSEESFSVAIHPSGLYILVGFNDKLRIMNLLIDDIRPFREFTIRGCKECRFSNGGQYFAAVSGNSVQIYSTWNFENLGNLKGHNGKVRSIYWTYDDSKIVTAGTDGAIYEWSLKDMSGHQGQGIKRESESILKSCSYSCCCMTSDGKTVYAVGNDKTLKEIADGQIIRELESENVLTQVLLSHSGKMMFVGTSSGAIRSMKYPFSATDAGSFQEHQGHSSPVSRLSISYDDQYLFSVSEDGSFYIFKIYDKDGRTMKREREIVHADEILVTKSDLEEKNSMMSELKTRVEELKMENEYQLRLKDMNFSEKIKQVTEKFMQEIETLKITSTVLRTDKEKEELRHEEEMAEEKERHSKDLLDMENSQNVKLMAEYDKYQELQIKTAELQDQWEHQMREMQQSKNTALEELNKHFEQRLQEKQNEMDQLQEEIKRHLLEYEETAKETEQDADAEIIELRHRYEKKLKDEREIVLRLKGENGIMRKKFNTLQGEIDTHKGEISKMYNEEKKLHSVIKSLEKDIAGLKKEIHERDETIQDKEKRIYDLKKKNQELEKFKFVLDYKIKELKKQIEPREKDIKGMTQQIKDMDIELENYHRATSELELAIADLKLKLRASEKEVQNERVAVQNGVSLIRRFKVDLQDCIQYIQEPKLLKTSLKKLYHKYCIESSAKEETLNDTDPQQEYARQREYLERTVTSLRKKQSKDQVMHKMDNVRIMQENVVLITEINNLRRDIQSIKQKEKALEVGLKNNRGSNNSSGHSGNTEGSLPPLQSDPSKVAAE
ncbi:Cilia- and flagella-associated protein 57 [Boothiomyces sp. JEL0866]|nr:Cilia- and flagella-associated protein 57 [Boothiomyces sp. JEL0866]